MRRSPKNRKRVVFEAEPMVWIRISGKYRDFPMIRDDGDLVQEIMEWMLREGIHSTSPAGTCGGGCYSYGHSPEDAKKIMAWLKKKGIRKR